MLSSTISSNMLKQVIVDAQALKDAALKNAQTLILERYANELQETIHDLLEVDDEDPFGNPEDEQNPDPLAAGPNGDPGMAPTNDPTGGGMPGLDGAPPMDSGLGGMGGGADITDQSFMDQIPGAATETTNTCACPEEDEMIDIDFNNLSGQLDSGPNMQAPGSMEMAPLDDPMASSLPPEDYEDEERNPLMENDESNEDIVRRGIARINLHRLAKEIRAYPTENVTPEEFMEMLERIYGIKIKDLQKETYPDPDHLVPLPSPVEDEDTTDKHLFEDMTLEEQLDAYLNDMEPTKSGWMNRPTDEEEYEQQHDPELDLKYRTLYESYNKLNKKHTEVSQNNTKLKNLLTETTKRLEEINISNSKLLYTNRILNSNSLNERQKVRIVEAISKATSVEEAKTVFETLRNSVSSLSNKKTNDTGSQTLKEALSRQNRVNLQIRSNADREDNSENPQTSRWAELAGIKKKE